MQNTRNYSYVRLGISQFGDAAKFQHGQHPFHQFLKNKKMDKEREAIRATFTHSVGLQMLLISGEGGGKGKCFQWLLFCGFRMENHFWLWMACSKCVKGVNMVAQSLPFMCPGNGKLQCKYLQSHGTQVTQRSKQGVPLDDTESRGPTTKEEASRQRKWEPGWVPANLEWHLFIMWVIANWTRKEWRSSCTPNTHQRYNWS